MKHLPIVNTVPKHERIRDYVWDAIQRYGDHNAFVLKQEQQGTTFLRSISYASFWEEMRLLGSGLIRLGLQGKRIALIGFNSYEWILSYLSVLCGVGVIVPLDKELTEPEILLSLERSKSVAVIFDEKHSDLM